MFKYFRTDNAIKNHFYSKLRKFIRKVLKLINKDNLLKNNNIDTDKYNSDKIYKIIKKYKIPYNTLTKESILNLIINYDKNSKNGKTDNTNFLLRQKTCRKKSIKENENLYSEKINKRINLINTKNSKKDILKNKESLLLEETENENSSCDNDFNNINNEKEDIYDSKVNDNQGGVYSLNMKKKGASNKKLNSKCIIIRGGP